MKPLVVIKSAIYRSIYRVSATALRADLSSIPDKRTLLARLYLQGEGIEIGALNSPLSVPRDAKVKYVDCAEADELQGLYPGHEVKLADIVDDGTVLSSVADCTQDFVICCHVLEHLEDPVGALKTWFRVLKAGGILFLSIPDKRFTFDCRREVTSCDHLFQDHEDGPESSREAHFQEFEKEYRNTFNITEPTAIDRLISRLRNGRGNSHLHVWTQIEMMEFVVALRRYGLDFEVECFCSYGNEGTFVLRKGARNGNAAAESSLQEASDQISEILKGLKP